MLILGISCFYHDSAACLMKDGEVIAAAAEERFSRKKHDNEFPMGAITYCLDTLGLAMNEIDLVVFYEKPLIKLERILHQHLAEFPRSRATFVESMAGLLKYKLDIEKLLRGRCHYHGRVEFVPHHLAHAASSYYWSGFRKAAILTLDGVGEWETLTVGMGKDKTIYLDRAIHFPHSLGLFYSTMTAYLGFRVNSDEYKVMGLAAYGDPQVYREQMDKLIKIDDDGSFRLNLKYFDFTWADHMPSPQLVKLLGHPIRKAHSRIYRYHQDIAAATQAKLTEVIINLLNSAHRKYKSDNLCLAGGVALNSVVNGQILSQTPFTRLYITPDPGDGGGAMGAATYAAIHYGESIKPAKFTPYLGPGFANFQIKAALDRVGLSYRYLDDVELIDQTTKLLMRNQVIGWFQGRMEWGPRALGNRSILAVATNSKMQQILNVKVKKREEFRPFAPVILDRYVDQYFVADKPLPKSADYMLMVYPVKSKAKKSIPAVVHVDNTGRLQSLKRNDNPLYYDLINTYRKQTGVPVLINTSFNVDEPIVCTPSDAINTFLKSQIDVLVIGNFVVKQKSIKSKKVEARA